MTLTHAVAYQTITHPRNMTRPMWKKINSAIKPVNILCILLGQIKPHTADVNTLSQLTLLFYNCPNPMEKATEAGIGWSLIVDELDFNCFHWRNNEYSFRDTSTCNASWEDTFLFHLLRKNISREECAILRRQITASYIWCQIFRTVTKDLAKMLVTIGQKISSVAQKK